MKMSKRDFIEMIINTGDSDTVVISDSLYRRVVLSQIIKAEIYEYIKAHYRPDENIRYKLEEIAYGTNRSIEQVCYYVIQLHCEGNVVYFNETSKNNKLYKEIIQKFRDNKTNELYADDICRHFGISISKLRNVINNTYNCKLTYSRLWNDETNSYYDTTGRQKFIVKLLK